MPRPKGSKNKKKAAAGKKSGYESLAPLTRQQYAIKYLNSCREKTLAKLMLKLDEEVVVSLEKIIGEIAVEKRNQAIAERKAQIEELQGEIKELQGK